MVTAIVLSARVHSGESNASWIVDGLLKWLSEDTPASRWLLSAFVVRVSSLATLDALYPHPCRRPWCAHLRPMWIFPDLNYDRCGCNLRPLWM
jgi:hypothetical protein